MTKKSARRVLGRAFKKLGLQHVEAFAYAKKVLQKGRFIKPEEIPFLTIESHFCPQCVSTCASSIEAFVGPKNKISFQEVYDLTGGRI